MVNRNEAKVSQLYKYMYELKQAPRKWNEKFDNLVISNEFKVNKTDKCIYHKSEKCHLH